MNPNYTAINAAAQMEDPASVRSFYKELIGLRKAPAYRETVVYGTLEPVWEDRHNLMAYYRKGEKTLLVVGNFQKEAQEVVLPKKWEKVLINNFADVDVDVDVHMDVNAGADVRKDAGADVGDCVIRMKGYQVLVLEM